ncbi:hypothetical protein MKW94_021300 [Papaver nudicaule]|uniref:Ubiquitin-like protease family profile domain-containing protein n=1 Tax=Papaver nudicaule TaxID=74823 RepID=A0AA41VGS5_PAPNU|nr:hypothetical protein [Papaver nudicaule]
MYINQEQLVTPDSSRSTSGKRSSISSRIDRYPKPTQSIKREVHGPCRNPKFRRSQETFLQEDQYRMMLIHRCEQAKNLVLDTFRHLKKDDFKAGSSPKEDVISEASSLEEDSLQRNPVSTSAAKSLHGRYARCTDNRSRGLAFSDLSMELSVRSYRKRYESAERQKLEVHYLTSEVRKRLTIAKKPIKKQEEGEPFAPLTEVEESEVSIAFANFNKQNMLVMHQNSNIEITGEILQRLKPGAWLNDEVINVYFELLKEREQREPKKFLKCHFFNTFFYGKLISASDGYDFKAVRRWTTQKKIGYQLLECDKIFVPIHKSAHWCLAVINKKDQKFQYFDSLGGMDYKILKVLARYYMDEVKDKSGEDIKTTSWTLECPSDIPLQENGSDCGMFMIKYADFFSRGLDLCFTQKDMPYFRKRTAKEILSLIAE